MVDILDMSSGSLGLRTAHNRGLSYSSDLSPTANTVVLHRLTESSSSFTLANQEMKIQEVGEMARVLEGDGHPYLPEKEEKVDEIEQEDGALVRDNSISKDGGGSSVATMEIRDVHDDFGSMGDGYGLEVADPSNPFAASGQEIVAGGGNHGADDPAGGIPAAKNPFLAENGVEDDLPTCPQIRTNPRSKSDGVYVATPEQDEMSNGFMGENGIFSPEAVGSPGMEIPDSRYFELEFARREAENEVEQLKLQLKSKTNQLEQVQVALMSYEEEIMNLRKQLPDYSSGASHEDDHPDSADEEDAGGIPPTRKKGTSVSTGSLDAVSLETAEALSSKIVSLQTHVVDLEENLVHTKLENAQLREANDFLKSTLNKYAVNGQKNRSKRNLFTRG